MNWSRITASNGKVIHAIESQRGAMEVHLTPDEAEREALRLRKAAAQARKQK
jgi:hypothetical protein